MKNETDYGVGISNYSEIKDEIFYVDKTLFIKDFIEHSSDFIVITRPRKFGKSLNISMLADFLDMNKDSRDLFRGTKIYEHKDFIEKHMNKYPVIYLSYKNLDNRSFEHFIDNLTIKNREVFKSFSFILNNEAIPEEKRVAYHKVVTGISFIEVQETALFLLIELVHLYYGIKPIVLIDEFDTPIVNAFKKIFYIRMRILYSNYLGKGLNNNPHFAKTLLLGIKDVGQLYLYKKIPTASVFTIKNEEFSEYFGFTESEVKDTLKSLDLDTFDEVKRWYGGYKFGKLDMYNPWSFLNYLKYRKFACYWVNTVNLVDLKALFVDLKNCDEVLTTLINGQTVEALYQTEVVYSYFEVITELYYYTITLLYNIGYLKIVKMVDTNIWQYEVINNEVMEDLKKLAETIIK